MLTASPDQEPSRREVVVVLPDIRSTYNTGAFFRTADAAGVKKIFLTGITAPPPHPHLVKVSLGAEASVPWEYQADTLALLRRLGGEGYSIVAVEQTANSVDYRAMDYPARLALVFGNEVRGLPTEILALADHQIHLPMRGQKESLNVSVAGGIVLYHVLS